MDERAFRIAVQFLNAQVPGETQEDPQADPQKTTDPKEMPNILPDKEVLLTIENTLSSSFRSKVINFSLFKNVGIPELLVILDVMSRKFNDSGKAHEEFMARCSNLRKRLLSDIEKVALSNNKSIKDTLLKKYKANSKENADVEMMTMDFVTSLLNDAIQNKTKLIPFLNNL